MPINGLLLLDKPIGITSHDCIKQVKRLLGKKQKIGHTGTLDPFATGILPLCLGEATKISSLLLHERKSYQAHLVLGSKTDTADYTGSLVATKPAPNLSSRKIAEVFKSMLGEQMQIPPMYSAKKHHGVALHKLARQGKQVTREAHKITIYQFELLKFDNHEHTIDFAVECSKGTYIRTLAEQIAEALSTVGHLGKLQRLSIGKISLHEAQSFEQMLQQGCKVCSLTQLFERWLVDWKKAGLDDKQAHRFVHGQAIATDQPNCKQVYVCNHKQETIGIAVIQDNFIYPKRIFLPTEA